MSDIRTLIGEIELLREKLDHQRNELYYLRKFRKVLKKVMKMVEFWCGHTGSIGKRCQNLRTEYHEINNESKEYYVSRNNEETIGDIDGNAL